MSPRTPAETQLLDRLLGTDLALSFAGPGGRWDDADLTTATPPERIGVPADIATVAGVPAACQFLVDRLQTQQGELAAVGHPEYGSRHHELIGQPNNLRTQNLIKVYVLQALAQEPRIDSVLSVTVYATATPPRDTVQIDVSVQLIGGSNPVNLVVPFSLAVAA